jgi:gas vesicle protein
MSKAREKRDGLLIGTLIGGLIGSALALLYAPTSGKRLRKDISRKTEDFLDDANEYWEKSRSKAEEYYKDGKKKVDSFTKDAKKQLS